MKTNELDEKCPNCKQENLRVEETCCADRHKGWVLVKRCPKCGYKVRVL